MPDITITGTPTNLKWQGGDPPVLRVRANEAFVSSANVPTNHSPSPFFIEVACSVNGAGHVVVPDITLASTEDSSRPAATYAASFHHANELGGASMYEFGTFGRAFRVPASPTTTTWAEIEANMTGDLPPVGGDRTVGGDLTVAGVITGNGSGITDADAAKIRGRAVSDGEPTDGQVLAWNATSEQWEPADTAEGGGGLPPSPLTTNLVASWKMDEASGVREDSVGANDLTPTASLGSVAGVVGSAVNFPSGGSAYLTIPHNADLSPGAGSFTLGGFIKPGTATTGSSHPIAGKWGAAGNRGFIVQVVDNKLWFIVTANGTTLAFVQSTATLTAGAWHGFRAWFDADADTINIQVNETTAASLSHSVIFASTAAFEVGHNGDAGTTAFAAVDNLNFWKSVLTTDEWHDFYTDARQYPFGGGVSEDIAYAVSASDLWDNVEATARTGYTETTPLARYVFWTEATSLSIGVYSNISFGIYLPYTKVTVRVNGVDHAVLDVPTLGESTVTTSLPTGKKLVEVVSAHQTLPPSSPRLGIFLKTITTNAAITVVPPERTGALYIHGDSIGTGGNCEQPSAKGWGVRLRAVRPRSSVVIDAWGFHSLHAIANSSGLRTATVARVASASPSYYYLDLGTNDYGLSKWSAASYGTALAAYLDELHAHAALALTKIYVQTPMLRTDMTGANSFGSVLADYRTQAASVQSTRSWVALVDGTDPNLFVPASDSIDGLHPTCDGHAKKARYVRGVLGW